MTDNKAFVISTGYISFLLGLVTVLLHNVWVWDWPVVITILGWSTMLKGISKIGFPDMIHDQAQRFKQKQWLSAVFLIILGTWLLFMGFSKQNSAIDVSAPFRDGKYLGYIHNVDTSGLIILFDDAIWLTGAVAQEAAIEAGRCTAETRSECLPNDYFIKNTKIRDEIVPLDEATLLFMQTWKIEETGEIAEREIGLTDFADLINNQSLHWQQLPYNISIQNGKINRIEEVYIP